MRILSFSVLLNADFPESREIDIEKCCLMELMALAASEEWSNIAWMPFMAMANHGCAV
jgi:hypothetical protein